MKNEMKMSDVFDGDVVSDADTLIANGYGELADFSGYKKECRYVAHAINMHDQHVERIKELEKSLGDAISWLEIDSSFNGSSLQEQLKEVLNKCKPTA